MSVRYSTPHVHYPQLSEVQMSYFYFCLCVCQYLWIIKFLEWVYRKKMGDMRGYFHRLGYWGFIIRLILLHFSFVFYINLPIRKTNRMASSFRFWALFDYWIFPRLVTFNPHATPPSSPFVNMTELLTTVIQVGGLTHHFLGKCLYQVGNMIVVF